MGSTAKRADAGALAVLEAPRPAISPFVGKLLEVLNDSPVIITGPEGTLAKFDLDSLIEAGVELEQIHTAIMAYGRRFGAALNAVRDHVCKTMEAEGATLRSHPLVTLEMTREYTYERDPGVLDELQPIIGDELFGQFIKVEIPEPVIKVDLRKRSKIEKYGDKAREILNRGIKAVPGPWKLKWTLKQPADPALEGGN